VGDARERLLTAAYELFSRQGVQAVGVDAIIERSGVARQTMYRHFGSKQELVLAFMQRREELWTRGWLQTEIGLRAQGPREQLLAIFDVFDEWFRSPGFEGCSFINVMLEHPDENHPLHLAAADCLASIRGFLEGLARQAGIAEADEFARQCHILMKGSIVSAQEGDRDAAVRAKKVAALLLAQAEATGRARKNAVMASSRDNRLVSPVRAKPSRR
jgi:AcrR family transcriptional regulator